MERLVVVVVVVVVVYKMVLSFKFYILLADQEVVYDMRYFTVYLNPTSSSCKAACLSSSNSVSSTSGFRVLYKNSS